MIIYKATNLINNMIYIGQTTKKLKYRRYQHIYDSKHPERSNNHFHNAIAKYGEDAFKFEIIDTASTQEELDEKERYWIRFYKADQREFGYNEDEGGKSGGKKSQSTKDKIGETTKLKWKDPNTANKMREGLSKGTEEWIRICKERRVLFTCPYCGKQQYLAPWEAKNKTACSKECKANHGGFEANAKRASNIASAVVTQRNSAMKKEIGEYILNWCESNPQIILSCPANKITTTLRPMLDLVKEKYQISDIRSLFKCFNVTSRKDFLFYLKDYLSK